MCSVFSSRTKIWETLVLPGFITKTLSKLFKVRCKNSSSPPPTRRAVPPQLGTGESWITELHTLLSLSDCNLKKTGDMRQLEEMFPKSCLFLVIFVWRRDAPRQSVWDQSPLCRINQETLDSRINTREQSSAHTLKFQEIVWRRR